MKDTYTLEDVLEAFDWAYEDGDYVDGLITRHELRNNLQKSLIMMVKNTKGTLPHPPVEFADGEVVCFVPDGTYHLVTKSREHDRKQTTSEAGAWELIDTITAAIELIDCNQEHHARRNLVLALDKWRKDRGEMMGETVSTRRIIVSWS